MSRSRLTFLVIIVVAVAVVVVGLVLQNVQSTTKSAQATSAFQATLTAVSMPGNANNSQVPPVFAGNTPPTDQLPQYVCAADAFGSYYALEQMQVAGYDVQNGFHLGLVPFQLDGPGGTYDISEDARNDMLASGKIDCLFTTLDATALSGSGVITSIIDESAGADQFWVKPDKIKTLNDLKGKKITYSNGSVGQFFALYALAVAGLNPNTDVTMLPADSVGNAVQRFDDGQADAVSGWEPDVLAAQKSGQFFLGSDKLRVIVDVVMTSRQAIKDKPRLVQAFHDAWFRTLKAQFENLPTAANQIASWGNNDWSGINPGTAQNDLQKALTHVAQAGLTQNVDVMSDTQRIIDRLNTAKAVWQAAGQTVYSGDVSQLVDPEFVRQSDTRGELKTSASPVNNTFLLGSHPNFTQLDPNQGQTLAILPCRKFEFAPESAQLNQDSKRILDTCVVPILSSSTGIYLKIVGSAAWPAPDDPTLTPAYTDKDILDVAMQRAVAVRDYLVKEKGFDPQRFAVSAQLPPPDHRNTTDVDKQAQDRYVEMTLITVGR